MPAAVWRCGGASLDLARTRVMGIVNVTPDSFSDGGDHATPDEAFAWGMRLLDDGADILDVGGESTRPGFTPVSPEEEASRVVGVVARLAREGAVVSVDTRHAEVARAAVEAGALIVNDVSGFSDPAMAGVASASGCGCVVMRAGAGFLSDAQALVDRSAPTDPEGFVSLVAEDLLSRARALEAAGVAPERICIDPGPGFGTTPGQDVAVQRAAGRFAELGYPLMCAVSRKRFVGAVSGAGPAKVRDAASAGVACAAAARGARVVRVHDVAATAQALRGFEAAWGAAPRRRALVGLGSNLGDSLLELREAAAAVAGLPLTSAAGASRVYESEPAYLEGQPPFSNAVLEVATELHPMALLAALNAIEDRFGRVRREPNGPRTLDLDLLWMEGERHAGARLRLPHPLMGERDFVMRPLADVVGDAEAFCARELIPFAPPEGRVGHVVRETGRLLA